MEDITDFFIEILNSYKTVDVADAEIKRQIADDEDLRHQYRDWCRENGSTERNGFIDFCKEYLENQESVWDTLSDYDEDR